MDQPPPPKPVISSSFGVRVGVRLQDPSAPKSMSELHMDTAYVEARFHGDLNDNFGWVANFNASAIGYTFGSGSPVQPMDLIVKYHACDAFNVWAGRLLVPSDRSNFAGPFFMSPWNYPGVYGGTFIGPKTGPNGRDQGATMWGEALESKFKYFVGAYGIDQPSQPYYSARVSYAIQGSEPGYFGSSTYFGDKSVVAIGVGGQYQKSASDQNLVPPAMNGTQGTRDTTTFMADILAEEAVAAGTFTFEGQFYAFNTGERVGGSPTAPVYSPKEEFYILGSYLTPDNVGAGKIQPLVRLQQTLDPGWTVVDVQLGYIMKAYFLKLIANYQHTDANGYIGNAVQFGAQAQM